MPALHANVRLGKHPARHDPRTLQLANYLQPDKLPAVPASANWTTAVSGWGAMANDKLGDCTCAAAGHILQTWTANAATEIILPDALIIQAYSAITGYDPATGLNDGGAVELDVLNYWRNNGIGGHKIGAFAALEPGNRSHIEASVYLFGACYVGMSLPLSAQNQPVWSVPPGGAVGPGAPGSWGGHAVPVVGYTPQGVTVVTWGALKQMTWGFWKIYCEEAYAVLGADWINQAKQETPSGFDLAQLQQDLSAIR